jgi:alpha-mannosidase
MNRKTVTRIARLDGTTVPSQEEIASCICTNGDWRKRVAFEAELPALGMAEYRLHLDPKGKPPSAGVKLRQTPSEIRLSNAFLSLAIDRRTGWIRSLIDRRSGRETLRGPGARLLVCDDPGDAWGTDLKDFRKVMGAFKAVPAKETPDRAGLRDLRRLPAVRVIESGTVRTIVEAVQSFHHSQATLRFTIYARRPEIEIHLRLVWNEPRRMLKLTFPTVHETGDCVAEIPYGHLRRSQGIGEQAHVRWVAVESAHGAFGIAGCGPSGHDARGGELRLSLLRSPVFSHFFHVPLPPDRMHDTMDLGEHDFDLRLRVGSRAGVPAALADLADELTLPPSAMVHVPLNASRGPGVAPNHPLVEVRGKGLSLGALKLAEDGRDLIVRVVESAGRTAKGSLRVADRRGAIPLRLGPFEIHTLRIPKTGAAVRVCNLLEEED